jgi:uncharacterized protein (TIGR02145 family)
VKIKCLVSLMLLIGVSEVHSSKSSLDFFHKPIIDTQQQYKSVLIGQQIWMCENLNVSHFRNGDSIPEVRTPEDWERAGKEQKPAWCYYDNNPENKGRFGKLYNWYAVNDPRGLAPAGWHIPDDGEWKKLTESLGGGMQAIQKMKSKTDWPSSSIGNNESGFSASPGGYRYDYGFFNAAGLFGVWWSSPAESVSFAWLFYQIHHLGKAFRYFPNKAFGFSVRCVKDK